MSQLPSNMDIDINCDIIRGRSALSSKASSRNSSVFSSTSSASYHKYIELNNNLLDIEFPEPINSSQLSYVDQVDVGECCGTLCVKITRSRLCLFYFYFYLLFIFLFLEQLGLGSEVIGHMVTSVTIWWYGHNIGHKTWENEVKSSRTNDIIQHEYYMLTSCFTHGHLE